MNARPVPFPVLPSFAGSFPRPSTGRALHSATHAVLAPRSVPLVAFPSLRPVTFLAPAPARPLAVTPCSASCTPLPRPAVTPLLGPPSPSSRATVAPTPPCTRLTRRVSSSPCFFPTLHASVVPCSPPGILNAPHPSSPCSRPLCPSLQRIHFVTCFRFPTLSVRSLPGAPPPPFQSPLFSGPPPPPFGLFVVPRSLCLPLYASPPTPLPALGPLSSLAPCPFRRHAFFRRFSLPFPSALLGFADPSRLPFRSPSWLSLPPPGTAAAPRALPGVATSSSPAFLPPHTLRSWHVSPRHPLRPSLCALSSLLPLYREPSLFSVIPPCASPSLAPHLPPAFSVCTPLSLPALARLSRSTVGSSAFAPPFPAGAAFPCKCLRRVVCCGWFCLLLLSLPPSLLLLPAASALHCPPLVTFGRCVSSPLLRASRRTPGFVLFRGVSWRRFGRCALRCQFAQWLRASLPASYCGCPSSSPCPWQRSFSLSPPSSPLLSPNRRLPTPRRVVDCF